MLDTNAEFHGKILAKLKYAAVVLGGAVTLAATIELLIDGNHYFGLAVYWVSYLLAVWFLSSRIFSSTTKVLALIVLLYFIGLSSLIVEGLLSPAPMWFIAFATLTGSTFGGKPGIATVVLGSVTVLAYGVIAIAVGSVPVQDNQASLMTIFDFSIDLFVISYICCIPIFHVVREYRSLARQEIEQAEELKSAIGQLSAANEELDAYSHTIAHDLKAPLRHIDGYTDVLDMMYSGKLGPEGMEFVKKISESTKKSIHLVEVILRFSRSVRSDIKLDMVDLGALALRNVEELKVSEPARNVSFSTSGDLTAECDFELISVVLENLLGNAWKFTRSTANPQVSFSATIQNGKKVFCIRDNGAGFSHEQAQELFKPFTRLHSPEIYEGTGIGLATVKRIILRHNGDIWAEGEPGYGAAIYFTLG